ncbi:MAG: hypothetical protein WKF57_01525 [Nakamurella sp.]
MLDVDGPPNPTPPQQVTAQSPGYRHHSIAGIPVLVGDDHPRLLARLAEQLDLVWVTTWEEEANEWWSPAMDLPALPVCPTGLGVLEQKPAEGVF